MTTKPFYFTQPPKLVLIALTLLRFEPVLVLVTFANMLYFEHAKTGTLAYLRENYGIGGEGIGLWAAASAVIYAAYFFRRSNRFSARPLQASTATIVWFICHLPIFMYGLVNAILLMTVFITASRTLLWLWVMFLFITTVVFMIWLGYSQWVVDHAIDNAANTQSH